MRGQIVGHEDPAGVGIGREGLLDVRGEVDRAACLVHRRSDHFARRDFEVANTGLRAVTRVFELASLDLDRSHGLGRAFGSCA